MDKIENMYDTAERMNESVDRGLGRGHGAEVRVVLPPFWAGKPAYEVTTHKHRPVYRATARDAWACLSGMLRQARGMVAAAVVVLVVAASSGAWADKKGPCPTSSHRDDSPPKGAEFLGHKGWAADVCAAAAKRGRVQNPGRGTPVCARATNISFPDGSGRRRRAPWTCAWYLPR